MRDLPDRQQTLRSTLRWSYDLLDDDARAVFAAFAVVPGGVTLPALERVAPAAGASADVLDALEQLVDQGLVQRPPDASGRFRTLQVVRELAAELLIESGRAEAVQGAEAVRLVELVEQAEPLLVTARQKQQLDLLQAEYDNLRASLDWALEAAPRLAARVAAPLWRFWQMRGRLIEGRALLERLVGSLDASDDDELALRARTLTALGGVAYWQSDHAAAEAAYREATVIAERLGDRHGQAEGLYNQGFASWQQDRFDEALARADAAGALFAALGDDHDCARARWLRGIVEMLGGDLDAAEQSLRGAVVALRGGPDVFHLGWALRVLGRTLLQQGRAAEARPYLQESLRIFAPARDLSAVVLHLADFARLAGLEGDLERQLRLVGAMRRLQQLSGTNVVDHPINQVDVAAALRRAGPAAEQLLRAGAVMDDEEATRYALEG
jgi:tetratricopeptide (TPR) repeat protein